MKAIFAMGLMGLMLCFVAPNPAAAEEPSLSADEVKQLFSGNTEKATGLRKRRLEWSNYCDPDGSLRGEKEGNKFSGRWYVDAEGRHCFRWDHKDDTKCDQIVPEGAGSYLRVRDGEAVARIKFLEGNPGNL